MVDLDLYRVFYTVVKCGSLTKAAEELFISQPAVSQAIKQLESQLGGKLFNRVSRGMELTENGGKQMFEIVSEALRILDSAEDKFKASKNIATGILRISAADPVVTHILMPYIKQYHELYPNVTITFKSNSTKGSLDLIKTNKADIAFVNLPVHDKEVLMTGQTGMIEDIFVAGEKYKELMDKVVDIKDLPSYPILMLDNTTQTTKEIMNFFDTWGVNIIPEFEISSVELLIEMAKNGLGIACIPRRYVQDWLDRKELFEIKVMPALPLRALGIAINKDASTETFAIKEFLRILGK